jgi:1-acyl-sn-glycerol-3-phosphate acyltransferase
MPRYRNEPIYTGAIGVGRAMFGVLRVKREVTGLENLPAEGGAVIAITHFGYLEFALVEWVVWLANRRRIRFMAKKSAFKGWPLGAFMRNMKHIPVGLFPEGTVSRSFEVQRLKTGAARLAQQAGVPIVPIAVWGGHRILTKGAKGGRGDRFGVLVKFTIGAPLTVAPGEDVLEATERLRATLQTLTDDLQAGYPVDGAGKWWQPARKGGTAPTVDEIEHEQRGSKRQDPLD